MMTTCAPTCTILTHDSLPFAAITQTLAAITQKGAFPWAKTV
jgi:hypothetical protein